MAQWVPFICKACDTTLHARIDPVDYDAWLNGDMTTERAFHNYNAPSIKFIKTSVCPDCQLKEQTNG